MVSLLLCEEMKYISYNLLQRDLLYTKLSYRNAVASTLSLATQSFWGRSCFWRN